MQWWLVLVLAGVGGVVALFGWAWVAVNHDERKQKISWWAARNGFRYSKGSDQLLDFLGGATSSGSSTTGAAVLCDLRAHPSPGHPHRPVGAPHGTIVSEL